MIGAVNWLTTVALATAEPRNGEADPSKTVPQTELAITVPFGTAPCTRAPNESCPAFSPPIRETHQRRISGDPVPSAAEEVGDLVQGALGGGQADALGRALAPLLQPLEGQRQVRPPLGGGQSVDLVDDHRLDPDQGLPGR